MHAASIIDFGHNTGEDSNFITILALKIDEVIYVNRPNSNQEAHALSTVKRRAIRKNLFIYKKWANEKWNPSIHPSFSLSLISLPSLAFFSISFNGIRSHFDTLYLDRPTSTFSFSTLSATSSSAYLHRRRRGREGKKDEERSWDATGTGIFLSTFTPGLRVLNHVEAVD
ncbi:hypothetical protein LOAG_03417 [Loa loa]|uniref:Uncharacterized protein n=1 Tax=Loa loa TaxID=7209 RepID=A0A1S0U4S9_LOALO|nr:hypothetical protein LOAG_03417 [Loa loa]EFO25071.1 hypothetical protein LOAG_03417 [Loa loa]